MGSAIITLNVTDAHGKKCTVRLQWKGDHTDLDRLAVEMDKIAYTKGVAPEQLALSTAFQLPSLVKHGIGRFSNSLLYWVFSLPTNDPTHAGTFFDYAGGTNLSIDVTVVDRHVSVSSLFHG